MKTRKPKGYWDYKKCKEEALKYNSKSEFAYKNSWVYKIIHKNKWIELMDHIINKIKPKGYWTYERCKKEALKYNRKIDLVHKCESVYQIILKNKWIELMNHMEQGWTYEKCKEEALKYNSKSDFKKNSLAYTKINKNKWYELTFHMVSKTKPKGYWTYKKCKEEALKYNKKIEFRKKCTAYHVILKNKWHELMDHLIEERRPNYYWTYENCKSAVIQFNNKEEFRKKYGQAYQVILKNKWYELFEHMPLLGNKYNRLVYVYEFSDNYCYVGLTYNIIKRNNQHLEEGGSVYEHIIKTGLIPSLILKSEYINVKKSIKLEEYILNEYKKNNWFILNKNKTGSIGCSVLKWNKDACELEVQKYDNLKDFRKHSSGAHNSAHKNKWAEELFTKYFKGYKKRNILK